MRKEVRQKRQPGMGIFVGVLLLVLTAAGQAGAEEVVLGNGEWKPYQSQELKEGGFASHLVSEVFENIGITVEYKWYGDAWKRAYKEAQRGKTDGTMVWSYKEERAAEFFYSENSVISGQTTLLFYLKSNPIPWDGTPESLSGYTVSGVIGYTYGDKIDEAEEEGIIDLERVSENNTNFRKLLAGRVDGIMVNSEVGSQIIQDEFPNQASRIETAEVPIKEVTYHLLLRKGDAANEELMNRFDASFDQLEESGRVAEFQEKFQNGWYEQ